MLDLRDKLATSVIVVSAIMMIFVLVYEGAYAFYTTSITTRNDTNNKIDIEAAEVEDITVIGDTLISMTNMLPGDYVSSKITVSNPNSVNLCFTLTLTNVVNTYVNKDDLRISVLKGTSSMAEAIFPTAETVLLPKSRIDANTNEELEIRIDYVNRATNQIDDMEKEFGANIVGKVVDCNFN